MAPVIADGRYCDARSDRIHGVPPGVQMRLPGYERAVKRERWVLPVSTLLYADWEQNLRDRITDKYGESDIIDFIMGRPGHVAGHWICSAHYVNSLQHVKLLPYPLAYEAHQLTPDDAYLLTSSIAGFKKSNFWDYLSA